MLFNVECDSLEVAIEGLLSQKGKVVNFLSEKLHKYKK
jgi:hypothetical protein